MEKKSDLMSMGILPPHVAATFGKYTSISSFFQIYRCFLSNRRPYKEWFKCVLSVYESNAKPI